MAISTTWWGQKLCEMRCVLAWLFLHAAKGHRKVPTPLALHDAWAPWGLEAAHSVAWGWGGCGMVAAWGCLFGWGPLCRATARGHRPGLLSRAMVGGCG